MNLHDRTQLVLSVLQENWFLEKFPGAPGEVKQRKGYDAVWIASPGRWRPGKVATLHHTNPWIEVPVRGTEAAYTALGRYRVVDEETGGLKRFHRKKQFRVHNLPPRPSAALQEQLKALIRAAVRNSPVWERA